MQPQGGALECAEMSVCACRGRRHEERVTESDKEKEHEGERRGVIFRHSRVCAESRAVEISNWPPHFPVASLPLTHGALEITGRSWELGFCFFFWVAITHAGVFIRIKRTGKLEL